jgi:hypothetical protein
MAASGRARRRRPASSMNPMRADARGRARARADDAVAAAALREGDMEGRRRGKKEENGGAHVWRGNGGPPEMEGGRGNLEGPQKWRAI